MTRVAIANPEHAPYGRAAQAALERAGVLEKVRPKLVLGDSVSQALQFVQSGSADAGIVALSLATGRAAASAGRRLVLRVRASPPRAGRHDPEGRRAAGRRADVPCVHAGRQGPVGAGALQVTLPPRSTTRENPAAPIPDSRFSFQTRPQAEA